MAFKKGDRVVLRGEPVGVGTVDVVGSVPTSDRFPSGTAVNVLFDERISHAVHGTGRVLSVDEGELSLLIE